MRKISIINFCLVLFLCVSGSSAKERGYLLIVGGGLIELKPDGSFNQFNVASTDGKIPGDIITHLEIHNNVIWASTAAEGIVRLANLINKVPTSVADRPVEQVKPSNFALYANYPNPFNPTTTIRFDLDKNANIELAVYNVRGELVNIIASGYHSSGSHLVNWNGKDRSDRMVPSGIYIYKLKVGEASYSRKMTLLK